MNNIIKMLEDNSISLNEKEKYLTKNKLVFKLKLYLLSGDEIIYLLFKSNIANSLKVLICEMVDKLSERKKETIIFSFLNYSNNKFDNNLLRCKYVPLIIKNRIVNACEKADLLEILNNKEESLKLKKLIIDIIFNDPILTTRYFNYYENLINVINSKNIIDYIIDNKINYKSNTMIDILKSSNIEIQKIIINKYVNEKNILNVLTSSTEDVEKIITILKSNELKNAIKKASVKELYDIFYYDKVCPLIENIIFDQAKSRLYYYCLCQPILLNLDKDIFYKENGNSKLRELMYKTHKKRLYLYVLFHMQIDEAINWLISSTVNEKLKIYIYITKLLDIQIMCRLINMDSIEKYVEKKCNNNYYDKILNLILKYRKEYILKNLNQRKPLEILNFLSKCENQEFKDLIIKNCVNKDNIFNFLISNINLSAQIIECIIVNNNDLIIDILKKIDDDDIFRLKTKFYPDLDSNVRNLIVKNNQSFFKERLKKFDYDILIKKLKSDLTLKSIKLLIIENFGYDECDSEIIRQLIKKCEVNDILNYYNSIKDLFKKMNVDINFFNQYGIGSLKYENWRENLILIIKENDQENFIKVKNYFFNNYYNLSDKENMVYNISNFLEILSNYNRAKELFEDMSEKNILLNNDDKKNLNFFFKTYSDYIPNKFEELKKYRYKIYEKNKNKIQDGISLYDAHEIFDKLFFNNIKNSLNQIGDVSGLKKLQLSNKDSKTINELSSEIILYSKIVNLISNITDEKQINNILRTIFSSYDNFEKIQNMFLNIDEKIQKLYELDSQINLTKIDSIKYLDDIVDKNLSSEYGGKVYDFSNKNYCLYAHVLSNKENIQDLMSGISTFKSNFISLSPISYKGQKYYYDNSDLVLAFDRIPTGSFICSSIRNMGSNCHIISNSSEIIVNALDPIQRGILETSSAIEQNSETLLYREGLIPCGIILPNGKTPSNIALKYHKEYNLPFIITQNIHEAIENPQKIFEIDDNYDVNTDIKQLNELINILPSRIYINKESDIYTGRRIAIITDSHALYEPTLEVLEDIKNKGINEIYSLGDNIGSGPNPAEVIDLLDSYNVKSVAGNSEYYMTLGTDPFEYLDKQRIENEEWTYNKLGQSRIERLKLYHPSYDIMLGDKKVALCHFINDVRCDFMDNNTWKFQEKNTNGERPVQFYYTNSKEAKNQIELYSKNNNPKYVGYKSALEKPLFDGRSIKKYDEIIQGHVHFNLDNKLDNILIHTLRAVGMGFESDDNNTACYYILKEKKSGGFDKEKVLVPFNRNYLLSNIITSSLPHKEKILKYLN